MAYLTVTTPFDVVAPGDGKLSLREALTQANGSGGPDTIRFSATVVGKTLVLTGGELPITDDLTIDGNNGGAATQTAIDANRASRVLSITGGVEANLSGLIITKGRTNNEVGGGIFLGTDGSLALIDCVVIDNDTGEIDTSEANGGGLFGRSISSLKIYGTSFAGNSAGRGSYAYASGGAIYVSGAKVVDIRNSTITGNNAYYGGGIHISDALTVNVESTAVTSNFGYGYRYANGGRISVASGTSLKVNNSTIKGNSGTGISSGSSITTISGSSITGNGGYGIASNGRLAVLDSSVVNHRQSSERDSLIYGAGIISRGPLVLQNNTITGNSTENDLPDVDSGAGIKSYGTVEIFNSIITGNFQSYSDNRTANDISGAITFSNGHNVFGTDVQGNVPGDRENFAPSAIFAAVDPATGGGKLGPDGTVGLKNNLANPALSAGDPLAASTFDQRGAARPLPAGSLPDLGAVELNQPLSTGATANNDVRAGTNAANNLTGVAGNDYLKGLGGNDTMDGGNGSDVLDGGTGNDRLTGGTGVDLVAYPGAAAVVVDLSGTTDTARRTGETDTLIGIEGALGSGGNDTFKGDALPNEFQGKAGKDTFSGGSSRDTCDFNDAADSPAGATRDLVTDFDPSVDVLDLAGIDADSTVPGNQSFRWVAKATLTGAAQLGYFVSGGMTIVRASTDADAAPELEIQLTGVKVLTAGDFRP